MHNALLIAELSLREAVRKRLVTVLLILSALFIGFYLYGIFKLEGTLDQRAIDAGLEGGRSKTGAANLPIMTATLFGMYLVYFLGALMSVLSTVGAVSGDIENGVMQSIIARPMTRAQLVLGRWIGFTTINLAYVGLLSASLLGGIYLITNYLPPVSLPAVGLVMLAMTLLTALTVLGSTLFTTLANGIGVFVLYGLGFTGSILTAIGQFADSPTMTTLGKVATTIMPTNLLWLGASYLLQPPIMLQASKAARGTNPLFSSDPIAPAMVAWAAFLVVAAVAAAMWSLSRRDL